jgi:NADPH:quinone reductase-like Zn-dependent oxidoreductase
MAAAIDGHGLKPVVDRVFPLSQADAAFRLMAGGERIGKVCIDFDA